jgi:hypothetical protein
MHFWWHGTCENMGQIEFTKKKTLAQLAKKMGTFKVAVAKA